VRFCEIYNRQSLWIHVVLLIFKCLNTRNNTDQLYEKVTGGLEGLMNLTGYGNSGDGASRCFVAFNQDFTLVKYFHLMILNNLLETIRRTVYRIG